MFLELLWSTVKRRSTVKNTGGIDIYYNSILIVEFGVNEIDEEEPVENSDISYILERNKNLYWHPCYYNSNLFNDESHNIIMTTLLCNNYGSLQLRLPMGILIYIFKFLNRSNFINI